jgi:Sec-independent protein translocase protein TatA
MDTLCGVGLPELLILALVSFVVIGPQRSKELAISTGRLLGRAMRSSWWREFSDVSSAIRNLPQTLVRMAELEETQADLRRSLSQMQTEDRPDAPAPPAARPDPAEPGADPWGISGPAAAGPQPVRRSRPRRPAAPSTHSETETGS